MSEYQGFGATGEPVKADKTPKSVRAIATLALVLVAGGTVGAVAYDAVVRDDSESSVLLGTLATASTGAIVVLASGKRED